MVSRERKRHMCSVTPVLSPGMSLVLEVLLVMRSSQDPQAECEDLVKTSFIHHGAGSPLQSYEPFLSCLTAPKSSQDPNFSSTVELDMAAVKKMASRIY